MLNTQWPLMVSLDECLPTERWHKIQLTSFVYWLIHIFHFLGNGSTLTLLISLHTWISAPVTTYDGTHEHSDCIFPFIYNGTSHKQCIITADRKLPWCATSGNYSAHERWGYCQGTMLCKTDLRAVFRNPLISILLMWRDGVFCHSCRVLKICHEPNLGVNPKPSRRNIFFPCSRKSYK